MAQMAKPVERRPKSGDIWVIDFFDPRVAELNIEKNRRTACVGNDAGQIKFRRIAFVPITGKYSKSGLRKALKHTVELPCGVEGQTKDGLIMAFQPETLRYRVFDAMFQSGATSAGPLGSLNNTPDTQEKVRHFLRQTLFELPTSRRPAFNIHGFDLRRGSVIELRNGRYSKPWLLVSSSDWLHTLECAAFHSTRLRGYVRGTIHCAPIFVGKPPDGLLCVEVPKVQSGLSRDGYCVFADIRSWEFKALKNVCGTVDQHLMDDIDVGLQWILT